MDENNSPASEVCPALPVQTQNPPAAAPVQAVAPPPAAAVVIAGTKTEREIDLERQLADINGKLTGEQRRALEAERRAAELERDNQELKKIPAASKRKRNWSDPVFEN